MENVVYKIGSELPETIFGKKYSEGYGTLSFNIPMMEENPDYSLLFHIYIDVSGSMSDYVDYTSRRTKMMLLKHALKNILLYFAEKCENVYVQVKGFDNVIHNYIDTIHINKTNVQELLGKIDPIEPMNSTNIELALNSLNDELEKEYFEIPIENRVAILLTDGEPTEGLRNTCKLVDIVKQKCSHHFIGLGNQHNGLLMHRLGHKNIYTTNWYINDIEHTGDVYGEILFNELHRVYYKSTIKVVGGKVYDYIKGEFVDNLVIGSLYAETTKNYHVMIEDEKLFNIVISGRQKDGTLLHTNAEKKSGEFIEIAKQYIRLCVQKLMFIIREETAEQESHTQTIFNRAQMFEPYYNDAFNNNINKKTQKDINSLLVFIKSFIKDHHLEDDVFMVELYKDVNVMKNSYGTRDTFKIVSGREDSQGKQTAFNSASQYEDDFDADDNVLPPKLQRDCSSAYRTPRRSDLMRGISDTINDSESKPVIHCDNTDPVTILSLPHQTRLGLVNGSEKILQRQIVNFADDKSYLESPEIIE
tara:strand:+ start:8518 stop:10110 length:1593 start_codon:yes stop_codon:yes gene_type:complete